MWENLDAAQNKGANLLRCGLKHFPNAGNKHPGQKLTNYCLAWFWTVAAKKGFYSF